MVILTIIFLENLVFILGFLFLFKIIDKCINRYSSRDFKFGFKKCSLGGFTFAEPNESGKHWCS